MDVRREITPAPSLAGELIGILAGCGGRAGQLGGEPAATGGVEQREAPVAEAPAAEVVEEAADAAPVTEEAPAAEVTEAATETVEFDAMGDSAHDVELL